MHVVARPGTPAWPTRRDTVVVLDERLDNAAHSALGKSLDACLEGDVWLDASGVEFLGGRCLELLISAAKTARGSDGRLWLIKPNETFLDHIRIMGVSREELESEGS